MCVFLSLRADKANLEKRFDARLVEEENFGPKYVQSAFEFPRWPVISSGNPGEIVLMHWGLIPFWIRNREEAFKFRINTVNARSETIFDKPAFRRAAAQSHCLVLADGFFEYREIAGRKFPYYIRLVGGEPFALAGLHETWTDTETGERWNGFSVITTVANPLMEMIHNRKKRMPAIIEVESSKEWLNPGKEPFHLIRPFPDNRMEAWPVSRGIARPERSGGDPGLLNPVGYPEIGDREYRQAELF